MLMMAGSGLFTCGTRVHMPSIRWGNSGNPGPAREGGKDAPIGGVERLTSQDKRNPSSQAYKSQVTELSKALTFSEDVVSSRSPQAISYAKARRETGGIFRAGELERELRHSRRRTTELVGRHDCRGESKKHTCHFYTPMEEPSSFQSDKKSLRRAKSVPSRVLESISRVSSSESDSSGVVCRRVREIPPSLSVQWEEQTLHRLSSATARRLVVGCPKARDRERMDTLLEKKPRNIEEATILGSTKQRSFPQALEKELGVASGPDLSGARLSGAMLLTKDKDVEDSPPKDFFAQLQGGARPVRQKKPDDGTIVLDNDSRFIKVLQKAYPQEPRDWCETEASPDSGRRYVRGQKRWTDVPQAVKTPEELQWVCQSMESLTQPPPLGEDTKAIPSAETSRSAEFFNIMHEWCEQWHIHVQLKDIDEPLILEGMRSTCDNSRMFAIASLAVLARSCSLNPPGRSHEALLHLTGRSDEISEGGVTPHLVEGLCRLLGDPSEHVRVPAAVTLYCINKQNEKAEQVLLAAVESPSISEQWASLQCLGGAGVGPAPVVSGLLLQLLAGREPRRKERAAELLARLSAKTPLVTAVLAEQMNSRGWQERLAACHMLPRLRGGINKDLCSKLVVLTWEDWSPEVRKAAAQALGLTGNGKLIHDEIKRRLASGREMVCLDALKKFLRHCSGIKTGAERLGMRLALIDLHSLHLMTSKLLPEYLSCFTDDHVSIRIEATAIASSLKLREGQVLLALQKLLQDPCWKVKAHALRALGSIGWWDEALVGQLLWALRFEKLAAVRAEACRAIATLRLGEERVVSTLKDLLTVEEDPLVLREVSLALQQLGCGLEREDDMMATIRTEVQRLGTRQAITSDVLHQDRKSMADYVIKRPKGLISTRDYLSEKHRYKLYGDTSHSLTHDHHNTERGPDTNPLGSHNLVPLERSWSPDRKTIDRQLEAMRKRCTLPATVDSIT